MTDERVDKPNELDELLSDLDAALSVQASPSVAAHVRRRIEQHPAPMTGRRAWFVAAAAAVILAAYGLWPRTAPAPAIAEHPVVTAPSQTLTQRSAAAHTPDLADGSVAIAAPRTTSDRHTGTARPETPAPARRTAATPRQDAEVLVSPSVRLGIEQLQAAVMAGRVSAESFFAADLPFEPTIITPTVIELRPVDLQPAPLGPSDTGSEDDTLRRSGGVVIPIRLNSPLSRTRSTL